MADEWLFNFFGTSSEEIFARGKQESEDYYLPKLNELSATNEQLASYNKQLASQVDQLKNLLKQNNISFE